MKKVLFIAIMLMLATTAAFGQKSYRYCMLMTEGTWGRDYEVHIDFGDTQTTIIDIETNKPMRFKSAMEAINLMATSGWELHYTYITQKGGGDTSISNRMHWVLKKEVDADSNNYARKFELRQIDNQYDHYKAH